MAGHETRQIDTINGASGEMDRHQYTSADSPAQLKPDGIICGRSIIAKLPVGGWRISVSNTSSAIGAQNCKLKAQICGIIHRIKPLT